MHRYRADFHVAVHSRDEWNHKCYHLQGIAQIFSANIHIELYLLLSHHTLLHRTCMHVITNLRRIGNSFAVTYFTTHTTVTDILLYYPLWSEYFLKWAISHTTYTQIVLSTYANSTTTSEHIYVECRCATFQLIWFPLCGFVFSMGTKEYTCWM